MWIACIHLFKSKLFLLFVIIQLFQIDNNKYLLAQSPKLVYYDNNGRLNYLSNEESNKIPDFSHAGYKNGEADIPIVENIIELDPVEGDNTAHIQNALDSVAKLDKNQEGIRGAVLLKPGEYDVNGSIFIRESGVILKGSVSEDGLTVTSTIRAIGEESISLIIAGGNIQDRWQSELPNTRQQITNEYIPVGSRSIEVENATAFSENDNVIIVHPSTSKWLASVENGGTDTDEPWSPNTIDIIYNRYIKRIVGNKIILDVPIFENFNRELSQVYIFKYSREQLKTHIGIENLQIVIQTEGELTENHFRTGIDLIHLEDSWVKNVTVKHFTYAAVNMTDASRITVENCKGLEPHSEITGGRRYNFCASRATNNVLFKNCLASNGRHDFVSNGISMVSGVVFLDCISETTNSTSEGHRRWSQGLLFDNITFENPDTRNVIGLYNRGRFGTGHGWSSSHSVAWNIKAGGAGIAIQKPPTSQNYAVGCSNTFYNQPPFNKPQGYIEEIDLTGEYRSLYEMQFKERIEFGIPPDAPARLQAVYNHGTVMLKWLDIAADESAYVIEKSSDGGEAFEEVGRVEANITTFEDTDLIFNSNIIYRVRATNDIGKSAYSNAVEVAILTNIYDKSSSEGIVLYPIPTEEIIHLKSPFVVQELEILDISGKSIYQLNEINREAVSIPVKTINDGVYFVKILDRLGRYYTTRFLKIK